MFSQFKLFSNIQLRLGRTLQQQSNTKFLASVFDELKRYNRKKQFENRNTKSIKQRKARALKDLTMRSLLKYMAKAKEVRDDMI